MITMDWQGTIDNFAKELEQMPTKLQNKVIKKTLRDRANEIKNDAKKNVKRIMREGKKWERWGKWAGKEHKKGLLQKSIVTRQDTKIKEKGVITFSVYNKSGTAYAIPLEKGHIMVLKGKKTGRHVPAYPFMKPAFEKHKDKVIESMKADITNAINNFKSLVK